MATRLAILSGKGGAGKTTVCAHLAWALHSQGATVALADADVEAPNLGLVLGALPSGPGRAVAIGRPVIDAARCAGCGACAAACTFRALTMVRGRVRLAAELCHGCGACEEVCPSGAIGPGSVRVGTVEPAIVSWPDGGTVPLVSGRTCIAVARSPAVVAATLESLAADAAQWHLVDGAPGAGCTAAAAIRGADTVLVVADDSPFGASDLDRVLDLLAQARARVAVVINRAGAHGPAEAVAERRGVPVWARIPEQPRVAELAAVGLVPGLYLPTWSTVFARLARRLLAGAWPSVVPDAGILPCAN